MTEQNATISDLRAREVLDCRGNPTVEIEVHCQGGAFGRASVRGARGRVACCD